MNSISDKLEMKDSALVVVDMLYDFIDGAMACLNAKEAVEKTAEFIDGLEAQESGDGEEITGMFPVLFVCDRHPAGHCSFVENGGPWPAHCVEGTRGAAIHDRLMPYVTEELTFFKGCDVDREQYSGWEGVNRAGQPVSEVLDLLDIRNIYVCGIATEYCVKATAEDLLAAGKNVTVIREALAFVDREGHEKALGEMRMKGIAVI